ncbi:unnamed protein product [Ceutorhynchus assimilis]|uniref:Uncharacterized protein n=1 Tax=Ceutorhynchus assimilis TaxID=467358 RepID=A0A9N9QP72_9CUCU|nr:unnamed protein product [Ceutorhynchus assimilis]
MSKSKKEFREIQKKDVTKSKEIKDLFGGSCDMCRSIICRQCSGVSSSEIRVLTAQTRVVTYYCPECVEIIRTSVKNLPTLKEQISSIEKKLSVLELPHKDTVDRVPVINEATRKPADDELSNDFFVALTTNRKNILNSQTELIGSQLNNVVNNIKDANKELIRFLTQNNESATPEQHKIGSTQLLGAEQRIKGSNKSSLGLAAAAKQSWFYVGNLSGNTTADQLKAHLESNNIPAQIDKETDESNDVDDDTALQDMNPDSEEPQKTNDIQEPDETEEHHEIQKPHGTQQSHETHELRVTQEPNESQQTPKTRIRVSNKERKPPQMTHSIPNKKRAVEKLDAAFEILTKASNKEPPQDPSECQIFGNLVAKKLSKYSNVAQTAVQEAIMNILFAADKGYYNQYPAPRGYQSNNYSTIQSELVQRDSVYQDTQLIQSPYSPRPAAHWDFATDASSQAPQFSPVPLPLISPASASSQCSGMTNYSASTSNPPPFTSATLLTDLNLPDN